MSIQKLSSSQVKTDSFSGVRPASARKRKLTQKLSDGDLELSSKCTAFFSKNFVTHSARSSRSIQKRTDEYSDELSAKKPRKYYRPVLKSLNTQSSSVYPRYSGKQMLEFFHDKEITYTANSIIPSELATSLNAIWEANKENYDYEENQEYNNVLDCINNMKDDASDNYASSVYIQYVSPEMGHGVFANRVFKKGEIIGQYAGNIDSIKEKVKDPSKKSDPYEYLFEFPDTPFKDFGIDASEKGNFTRYINHSSASSANVSSVEFFYHGVPRLIYIADRKIAEHEQLLYDYGSTYWEKKQ